MEALKNSPNPDDELIFEYEVKLEVNADRQGVTQSLIDVAKVGIELQTMKKNVNERLALIEKEKESKRISSSQSSEATGTRPVLAYDRSSPIHSSSISSTSEAEKGQPADHRLNQNGYSPF